MWHNTRSVRGLKLGLALAIFVIGIMGGIAATGVVYDTRPFSPDVTTAATLAMEQLEGIKAQGFGGLSSAHATYEEHYNTIPDFPRYRRSTSLEVNTPDVGMKKVTVTVLWDADTNAVRMSLILAE